MTHIYIYIYLLFVFGIYHVTVFLSLDGPFIISCDSDSLYFRVLPNNTVVATRDIRQASLFTIKPTDDGDNLHEFYLAHHGDKCKDECSLLGPQLKDLEPMARYLEARVNVFGKNPGPLKMKQNAHHESSRFALHGRLSTTFTPSKINKWVDGKEIFYINCSRREWAKDGYICVKKSSSRTTNQETFITACVSSTKSHDDRTCFMLFRLLPANLHD